MHLKFVSKSETEKNISDKNGIEDLDIPINIIDE